MNKKPSLIKSTTYEYKHPKPLVNQDLIARLGKHITNKKLKLQNRVGYCELSTLAGMFIFICGRFN